MKHILAAVIILLSVQIAYAGSGIITFENESLDLGNVDTGTSAKADFRFSNTGDGILKILKVKPG